MQESAGGGRDELAAIVAQCRRISDLVHQLLDFSRPRPPRRLQADAHEVLRSTLHLLGRPLATAGVDVQLEFAPVVARLHADPDQLQQVFTNIILNAQQAMPQGGVLAIASRKVLAGRDPHLEIEFEDTGPGIAEKHLSRIFEPFFSTKGVGKGTGLGLAICYSILRQHGGAIRAENVSGRGARFVVNLPLPKGAA